MESKGFFEKVKEIFHYVYENTVSYLTRTLFSEKVRILFLGIDNAGKTTLLNKLKNDTTGTFAPTQHSNKAEIEIGNMKASIVDLGGHDSARMIWKDYFFSCDGVIFIVDVCDTERFKIVKEAFEIVRNISAENLPPVAVFFNKVDLINHTSQSAENDPHLIELLRNETGIFDQDITTGQPIKVSFVSIAHESPSNLSGAMVESFRWLQKMISLQKKERSL